MSTLERGIEGRDRGLAFGTLPHGEAIDTIIERTLEV
jgi:hypothetical protein